MKFVKMETSDGRVVWIDKKTIVYVTESDKKEGCSQIVFECGAWVEVKGLPDELMLHKIGT